MNWKEQLLKFEQNKNWKSAFDLLQTIISKESSNLDAYLSMNYLLMNVLVEENYDADEGEFYASMLKKYFVESYEIFSQVPEYLFFIGKIACMSEWYVDLKIEEAQNLIRRAHHLDPKNFLYEWAAYSDLNMGDSINVEGVTDYSKKALRDTAVLEQLRTKGSLGKYLENALTYWASGGVPQ
ncbi:hypothetical protein [Chitinophaga arvensicola]|uniref:Tetratricopeptide repeat-containing protein n=1 Tax=Chitinophaga arvensicola TaxID=29529 RepID=A0A1I0SE26_9BACT|nr:hypothetical protein [Chitinophaga arvensicola]SEW57470.1 hypothetical protein SAMN04488122_6799 [Chitinophaga arvensicola]